jgi:hypothetical protein
MFRCACARFVGEQIQMDVCIGTCTFRVRVEEQLTCTIQCAPTNDDSMRADGSTSCKYVSRWAIDELRKKKSMRAVAVIASSRRICIEYYSIISSYRIV